MVEYHIAVEIVDLHLHLTKIFVLQLIGFEVDQHVALQQAVVKYQINKVVFIVKCKPLLACFKQESFTQPPTENVAACQ